MFRIVVLSFATAGALAGGCRADDIHLICQGTVTYADINHGSVFGSDNRGHFGSAGGYEETRGQQDGEVMVDLLGDNTGRIKVPAVMVPAIHDSDADGWRALTGLTVGDTEVSGRFSFNFADKVSVEIDRVSGHIEIKGINKRTFTGDCHPYDATTARKF